MICGHETNCRLHVPGLILIGGERRLSVAMSQEEGGDEEEEEETSSSSNLNRPVQPLVFVSSHTHAGEQVTDSR